MYELASPWQSKEPKSSIEMVGVVGLLTDTVVVISCSQEAPELQVPTPAVQVDAISILVSVPISPFDATSVDVAPDPSLKLKNRSNPDSIPVIQTFILFTIVLSSVP